MIDETLEKYKTIISEERILLNRKDNQIAELKARLILKDSSILEFSEVVIFGIAKRKYSYQWMSKDFELRIRWDNAFHHHHIATFPHHKHVGSEDKIEESENMTLEMVLIFINDSF